MHIRRDCLDLKSVEKARNTDMHQWCWEIKAWRPNYGQAQFHGAGRMRQIDNHFSARKRGRNVRNDFPSIGRRFCLTAWLLTRRSRGLGDRNCCRMKKLLKRISSQKSMLEWAFCTDCLNTLSWRNMIASQARDLNCGLSTLFGFPKSKLKQIFFAGKSSYCFSWSSQLRWL